MTSIGDTLSSRTDSLFDTSRDFAINTLRDTGNVVGKTGDFLGRSVSDTGDIASRALKGTANFGKKTINRSANIADNILHGKVKGTIDASGKLVSGTFNDIIKDLEGSFEYIFTNPYISTSIKVLIALYAAFAAPSLPKDLASLLDNSFIRILIAVLIVYIATKDSSMAILLALAFILSLQTANKYKLIDTSRSINSPGQLSWLPSANKYYEGFVGDNSSEEEYPSEESYPSPKYYSEDELLPGVYTPTHESTPEFAQEEESNIPHPEATVNATHHPIQYNMCGKNHHSIDNMKGMYIDETPELGSNKVPGANQNSCVQTFNNQHCSQGLNKPKGFDENAHYYSQA
jgi:hypothetical protein